MEFIDKTMNAIKSVTGNSGDISRDPQEKTLFDMVYDLWTNQSANKSTDCKRFYSYWNGDYKSDNDRLKDQTTTPFNVVKRVIEAKTANALDAKFTINVVPVLNSFATVQQLRDMHSYADILNSEVHNILKNNNFDSIKEICMRYGEIYGFSAAQTSWDIERLAEGEVKITDIDADNLRWDKNAKKIKDSTFFAYQIELSPLLVKQRYAKNSDNTYDDELVKKIDLLVEHTQESKKKKEPTGVVNASTVGGATQAYVYESEGIQTGKIVKLVVMFLLDDSVNAPTSTEPAETAEAKKEWSFKYKYGRMIIFSPNKDKGLIFDDKPLSEAFVNLGNIDIFKPMDMGAITGKSEVEDLIPIQDRINGAHNRLRLLIGSHINTVLLPEEMKAYIKEGAFVSFAVNYIRNLRTHFPENKPVVINNGAIAEAMQILELIEMYERSAYRTARINETTLSGEQQVGTTSAAQVDALQESPMGSIRSIQRNFASFVTSIGEKIITLIQENYNVQRLVSLATGISTPAGIAKYAKFTAGAVELYTEAGDACKTIKIDKNWKFKVDVVSGTEQPRSRKETGQLTIQLAEKGLLGNMQDPDCLELLLTEIDYPNYRAIMQVARAKADEVKNKKYTIQDVLLNATLSKSLTDFIESLSKAGRGNDISVILQNLGLSGKVDDLTTTPAKDITSRSDVKDVAVITQGKVSEQPDIDTQGRQVAGAIIDLEKGVKKA